jgi:biopolymer transport protein ExbD
VKFRAVQRDSPEINLTPLIDVVFLLLIFFMVSTTFERRSELSVELPEASAPASTRDDAVIDVVIDAGGGVHVEGSPLADPRPGSLQRALANAARGLDSPPVVISADAQTPHQSVVTVMDAARQAGLYKLTFAAQRSAEPPD